MRSRTLFAIALLGLAGCATAVESGRSTALDGFDLQSMTDDMAAKLGSGDAVNAKFAERGPLKVVVMPVVNEMRAEVLPTGQATAFTGRVRVLLSKHSPERFTWCMNRDAFYALRSREIDGIDPGPDPDRVQPQYALTATFSTITDEDRSRRESFYVCAFQLTDLNSSAVLWAGSYELKKRAVKGFLD